MFCMRCGAALPEGAKFCTACGQPAGAPSARAAAPAASPAFSRYLALVEGRAGAPGTYVADLCAWQFYSTRTSAALAKMKQFFFLREMEGADGAQAQAFAEACVQRALANYPGLPRGFQNGVVIYPVLCQQRATPGALEYVRALPKNHFAAFASPCSLSMRRATSTTAPSCRSGALPWSGGSARPAPPCSSPEALQPRGALPR